MGILESIAGISAGVVAAIGLYYYIRNEARNAAIKEHKEKGRSIEQQILEATTNEERARLVRLLDEHNS